MDNTDGSDGAAGSVWPPPPKRQYGLAIGQDPRLFTDGLVNALAASITIASNMRATELSPDHILVALLMDASSPVRGLVAELGVPIVRLVDAVRYAAGVDNPPGYSFFQLFRPRLRKIDQLNAFVARLKSEAAALGVDVATEVHALSVLSGEDAPGCSVMRQMGVTHEAIAQVLGGAAPE